MNPTERWDKEISLFGGRKHVAAQYAHAVGRFAHTRKDLVHVQILPSSHCYFAVRTFEIGWRIGFLVGQCPV